jgi:hypothetical protein
MRSADPAIDAVALVALRNADVVARTTVTFLGRRSHAD